MYSVQTSPVLASEKFYNFTKLNYSNIALGIFLVKDSKQVSKMWKIRKILKKEIRVGPVFWWNTKKPFLGPLKSRKFCGVS